MVIICLGFVRGPAFTYAITPNCYLSQASFAEFMINNRECSGVDTQRQTKWCEYHSKMEIFSIGYKRLR